MGQQIWYTEISSRWRIINIIVCVIVMKEFLYLVPKIPLGDKFLYVSVSTVQKLLLKLERI